MYAETMNIFHGQSDQIKDMIELQKFDNKIHREMVEKFKNVKQEFERMEHANDRSNKIMSVLHSQFQNNEFLINDVFE